MFLCVVNVILYVKMKEIMNANKKMLILLIKLKKKLNHAQHVASIFQKLVDVIKCFVHIVALLLVGRLV